MRSTELYLNGLLIVCLSHEEHLTWHFSQRRHSHDLLGNLDDFRVRSCDSEGFWHAVRVSDWDYLEKVYQ